MDPEKPLEAVTYEAVGVSAAALSRGLPDVDLTPGFLLADRYRVVALLGRGGMGEVYRADDLKLGQAVALKFLPRVLERDPGRLDRFLNEVRTAREVSHPNVCRVYDVGEVDGRHFLSMEYIDGEDLASLLRRIGRLPSDKAIDIARQLCAGLAAAHDKGVLHRDLKPANVMLDGRGKVRLTDFGLAEIAGAGSGDLAGTPAYMAPEQFAAERASVQTDIYALGLVLYEVFTGKRVFTADTVAELRRLHEDSRPASLTSAVRDIDPMVERVILRCLEKDPRNRPTSAIAVSAALPGGDPLAAALAAGETPSPDMVAAAGKEGALRPAVAACWFAAVIAGLVAVIILTAQHSVLAMLPLDYSPEVLRNKAQEMLGRLDVVSTRAVDTASGFDSDPGYKVTPQNSKALASGHLLLTFWYRSSPIDMVPWGLGSFFGTSGRVGPTDPPLTVPGMASVVLDVRGRLLRLETVPAQVEKAAPATASPIDWQRVLAETGVDPATATSTQPTWLPPTWADTRVAWNATYADLPDVPVRIEAAAYRGRPVYVRVVRPWTPPDRREATPRPAAEVTQGLMTMTILGAVLIASVVIARRNILLGRGDRRGAVRVGVATGALYLVRAVLEGNHFASLDEFVILTNMVGSALFVAAWMGLSYLAIEPYLRRFWPHTLIAWSRLLIGRLRDPLLGRDVLIGAAAGVGLALFLLLAQLVAPSLGGNLVGLPRLSPLLGTRLVINSLFVTVFSAAFDIFLLFFILFLFRLVLRRDWLMLAAFAALSVVQGVLRHYGPADLVVNTVVVTGMALVLVRIGLVAFGVMEIFNTLLIAYPFTTDLSSWYGTPTVVIGVVLAAMTAAAFRTSVAGQSLLGARSTGSLR